MNGGNYEVMLPAKWGKLIQIPFFVFITFVNDEMCHFHRITQYYTILHLNDIKMSIQIHWGLFLDKRVPIEMILSGMTCYYH